MTFALRALVLLAAVTPLFAATAFHPSWWQTLIAAAIGSGLGQLAVWATRDHRIARWAVAAVAAVIAVLAGAWSLVHTAPQRESSSPKVLVVGPVTADDLRAIKSAVDLAVPYARATAQLASTDQNWNTQVIGTSPDFFDLMNLHIAAGARFEATANKVVVLGETVATQLHVAVGETIRIKNVPFEVVGVLAHQGKDLDDAALIPIDVYSAKIAMALRFEGKALISPTSAEAAIRSLLRDRHRLAPGIDDDFTIRAN